MKGGDEFLGESPRSMAQGEPKEISERPQISEREKNQKGGNKL